MGQFHALYCCFNAPQGMAPNYNLVGGEDQMKALLLAFGFKFGESELVERQQKTALR
jgi:hypothetical protein